MPEQALLVLESIQEDVGTDDARDGNNTEGNDAVDANCLDISVMPILHGENFRKFFKNLL